MNKIIPPNNRSLVRKIPAIRGMLGQLNDDLNNGPIPLNWSDVPSDLHERPVQEYQISGGQYLPKGEKLDSDLLVSRIANDVGIIASTVVLDRGLIGRVITITSVAQVIVRANYLRGYLLLNPSATVGLTSAGTFISATTLVGATTFTSSSLGVANYKSLRLFLNISAFSGVGTVTFDGLTFDPMTGTFFTSQTIFTAIAIDAQYANIGDMGVDTDFQLYVTVPAGVTITFTCGFVLKDGLEGTSTGVAQTIFLGGSGVTSNAGYPLLSGREKAFYLKENTELYGVTSGPSLEMRVFEL